MAFCPEHSKWDQNPKFTPWARRRASPPLSYGSSLPPDDGLSHLDPQCDKTSEVSLFLSSYSVSGIICYDFVEKFSKKIVFYRPVNTHKPNFFSFLVFVGAADSLTALKFHLSKLWRNEKKNPVPKQWISKDIASYKSQSQRAKIAIHWFGEY